MIRMIVATLLVVAVTAVADEVKEKTVPYKGKGELSADLKEILKLLNAERAKQKLPALTIDAKLCKAADEHTKNMAKQDKMQHKLDGKGAPDRVTDTGYDWRKVGENLACVEGDPDDPAPKPELPHNGWMESKGHRANILDPKFTQVGLAMARSKKGHYYYTQVFATPAE